jgi:hypothetical protein
LLLGRNEDLRLWVDGRVCAAHVGDDPDDRHVTGTVEPRPDQAAGWIPAGERRARQRVVDDRDERRILALTLGEIASANSTAALG